MILNLNAFIFRDIKLDMKFSPIYNKETPQIPKILGSFSNNTFGVIPQTAMAGG